MKGVQIVGKKGSGKSTVALIIGKILKEKKIKSIYIKHSHHKLNLPEKDLKFLNFYSKVLVLSDETSVEYKKDYNLSEIDFLDYFVVLEGFKEKKFFPKILCYKDEKEKEEEADFYLDINEKGLDKKLEKILMNLNEKENNYFEIWEGNELFNLKPFLKNMLKEILTSFFKNLKLRKGKWIKIVLKIE